MSQEVLKLTINGEVKWRACDTNSGQISLDDHSLEPLSSSLDEVVDRLLSHETFSTDAEQVGERARLLKGYGDIENYMEGRFVVDLDGFFRSVERITQPEIAAQIGLTNDETQYLISAAEAIRQELSGQAQWHTAPSILNRGGVGEETYLKLFPKFVPGKGLTANPVLLAEEVPCLDGGLRYFDLLAGSGELSDAVR